MRTAQIFCFYRLMTLIYMEKTINKQLKFSNKLALLWGWRWHDMSIANTADHIQLDQLVHRPVREYWKLCLQQCKKSLQLENQGKVS